MLMRFQSQDTYRRHSLLITQHIDCISFILPGFKNTGKSFSAYSLSVMRKSFGKLKKKNKNKIKINRKLGIFIKQRGDVNFMKNLMWALNNHRPLYWRHLGALRDNFLNPISICSEKKIKITVNYRKGKVLANLQINRFFYALKINFYALVL